MRVVIDRDAMGGDRPGATGWFRYTTDADVDHHIPRSRRPDLRENYDNLRAVSRFCHRIVKHGPAHKRGL